MPLARDLTAWVESAFSERQTDYSRFEGFYTGDHKVELTDRLREFLKVADTAFNANFCEGVVDVMTDRLSVVGFQAEDEAFNQWLWEIWQQNRMDQAQRQTHTEACKLGDAYVMVDWDGQRGRSVMRFNEARLIRPHYDPFDQNRIDYAAKRWKVKDDHYLTLYYPDRIEKYMRRHDVDWMPRLVQGEEWPLPWLLDSEPIGVPVVHFRNKPGAGQWGRSELADVIPLQVILNKTLVDLVMVLDTQGFPQRYVVNGQVPSGGFRIFPGAVWRIVPEAGEDSGVQVGQFSSESPEGLIRAMDHLVEQIAAVTRTPLHLMKLTSGNFPSGEALQSAEQGLVSKIVDRQSGFGDSWEDVMGLARRTTAAFSDDPGGDETVIQTLWRDPATRNELGQTQTMAVKVGQLGIPEAQAWRELGYTPDEVAQMLEDKQREKAAQADLGSAILRQFNVGAPV